MAKNHIRQQILFRGKGAGASFDLGTISGLFLAHEECESVISNKSYPAKTITKKPTAKQIVNAKDLARKMLSEFSEEKLLLAKGIAYKPEMINGSGAFVLVRV